MAVQWTDDLRTTVVKRYLECNPDSDNSMEIVKEIAEEIDATPNGVRAILSKAEVYIKKTPAAANGTKEKTKRINKVEAIADLKEAIESINGTIDEDIIGKITGKMAVYFTGIIKPQE